MKLLIFRTILIYLCVLFAMRLMGKRQLGELQPAELVTTLLISNVASICIDEPDLPLSASLVPIFLITALEILNSTLVWFCPKYAQLLLGKPVTITLTNLEMEKELVVRNRIQAKKSATAFGTGWKNLSVRYKLLCGRDIVIENDSKEFTVKIPLLYE